MSLKSACGILDSFDFKFAKADPVSAGQYASLCISTHTQLLVQGMICREKAPTSCGPKPCAKCACVVLSCLPIIPIKSGPVCLHSHCFTLSSMSLHPWWQMQGLIEQGPSYSAIKVCNHLIRLSGHQNRYTKPAFDCMSKNWITSTAASYALFCTADMTNFLLLTITIGDMTWHRQRITS